MNRGFKNQLKTQVWEKSWYARRPDKATEQIFLENPAYAKLIEYCSQARTILDLGCGEGRILGLLWRKEAKFVGIDISKRAIETGKKELKLKKNIKLLVGDIEGLNLPKQSFDLVYSTYTMEHVDSPEKVINNLIRLSKRGGKIILICPNFGSPINPSNLKLISGATPFKRAIKTFVMSFVLEIYLASFAYLVWPPKKLNWNKVYPKVLDGQKWEQDLDATCEPYLQTLVGYLRSRHVSVLEASTFIKFTGFKKGFFQFFKSLVEFLGSLGIPPFKYFGPTLFLVGGKE